MNGTNSTGAVPGEGRGVLRRRWRSGAIPGCGRAVCGPLLDQLLELSRPGAGAGRQAALLDPCEEPFVALHFHPRLEELVAQFGGRLCEPQALAPQGLFPEAAAFEELAVAGEPGGGAGAGELLSTQCREGFEPLAQPVLFGFQREDEAAQLVAPVAVEAGEQGKGALSHGLSAPAAWSRMSWSSRKGSPCVGGSSTSWWSNASSFGRSRRASSSSGLAPGL